MRVRREMLVPSLHIMLFPKTTLGGVIPIDYTRDQFIAQFNGALAASWLL